jgi:hypothetical protein
MTFLSVNTHFYSQINGLRDQILSEFSFFCSENLASHMVQNGLLPKSIPAIKHSGFTVLKGGGVTCFFISQRELKQ